MFRKMPIGRIMYDVYSEEEYNRRYNLNPETVRQFEYETAIQKGNFVYPLQNPNLIYTTPGVKNYGPVLRYQHPQTPEEQQAYHINNMIDLQNNPGGCIGMIQKTAQLAAAEQSILTNKDNVTQFVIKDDDAPEFKLLKQALNQKAIDINSYRQRYQSNFSNDLRILVQGNSITFGKLKSIANASDMEVELIIRDKPGCVNPIGEELHTMLT